MESLLSSFGWTLSIITAAGNGFVIFLVAKSRRLHSSANWFVLSLAVADFIVGIAVFPSSYFCNKQSMACNSRVYMAFFWFFLHSLVTNLCTLTWDRYIAIVHPLKYNISMSLIKKLKKLQYNYKFSLPTHPRITLTGAEVVINITQLPSYSLLSRFSWDATWW